MRWRHSWLVAVTGAIAGASALAITVVFWDLPPTGIVDRSERAEIVRNLGLVIGGVLALGIAVWRSKAAQDQVDVTDLDRLDRQYSEAVSLLSAPDTVSRLAGIRMLERLANRKSQVFREDVVRVLCEFARNPTKVIEPDLDASRSLPRFTPEDREQEDVSERHATNNESRREEIEAAIRVISDCNDAAKGERNQGRLPLNLTGLALARAQLDSVNLAGANLERAWLVGANFSGADLTGVRLSLANLTTANLTKAHLNGAVLSLADLRRTQLIEAELSYAELDGAKMLGADVRGSTFTGALLSRTAAIEPDPGDDIETADEVTATGLTQNIVDEMRADDDNPPSLTGILDAETGEPLVWRS